MSVVKNRLTLLAMVLFVLLSIAISISISISRNNNKFIADQYPSHVLGSRDARVHVTGYFDLEASESRAAWDRFAALREQYADRVSIEFRHFPITAIHRQSMTAAHSLEAAGEQGKFWEYLDVLWRQQDAWESIPDATPLFIQYADQSGVVDLARFQEDVRERRFSDRILHDLQFANDSGVSLDTPFVMNELLVSVNGVQLATERILSKPN